jgi:hypothetical protein
VSEHFPENAIGEDCSAWCKVCHRLTRHRLDRVAVNSHASKAGPCLEHGAKRELTKAQAERRTKATIGQGDLFP